MTNRADFAFGRAWTYQPANHVDFQFKTENGTCVNYWPTYDGNQIPVKFTKLQIAYPGNQVPISFDCGEVSATYTFFPGFIEAFSGVEAYAEIATDKILNFVEFYDGSEILPGQICGVPSAIVDIGGGGTGTVGSTGFRLQTNGAANTGANVAVPKIDLTGNSEVEFTWTQSLSGPWFDNDGSDAESVFGLFFDRDHDNVSFLNDTWEYGSPFDGYSVGTNRPWLNYWLPRDSAAKSITPLGRLADGSAANLSAFIKASGIDLYANTEIKVKLVKDSGKVRSIFYINGTEVDNQLSVHDWPDSVFPLWHYHNYGNSTSYVDVSDVQVCSGGALLTTYPAPEFALNLDFGAGAEVTFDLSSTYAIGLDFSEGSEVSTDLSTYPPATISVDFAEGGWTGPVPLWTQMGFKPAVYAGEEVTLGFTTNPAAELEFDAFGGAAGSIDLSLSIQLGTFPSYSGASLDAVLDTLENYKIYDGAVLVVDIATSDSLDISGYGGEGLSLDLSSFPSEGMGTFRAYDGASVTTTIKPLEQVLLYPNEIKDPGAFNWDVLGFIGIDLNNGTCCPVVDSHVRIELTDGPAPDQRYDGDKTVFTADLSILPRFSVEFAEGLYFTTADPEYLTFEFFDGSSGIVSALTHEYYDFNLCKGNFIPDGDHVNVELVTVDLNNCESTLIFEGAEANVDIENNPQFALPMRAGENFEFDIVIDSIWLLRAYAGEYVRISNPEFTPKFYADAMSSFVFEEKDIVGYSGEAMSISGLVTDYSVEFLELGCLDNEFVPMNENGDADWEKFNPVPIELDFFTHSIKAKCF